MSESPNRKAVEEVDECGGEFILISVDDVKRRVEVHIRGPFIPAHLVTREIATLYKLSSEYDTVLVIINSPGGDVSTLTELLSVLDSFKVVITVAAGQVCSAGFLLWCVGHVRVTQSYATFMAHREGYRYEGKTLQHMDFAKFSERQFGALVAHLCDGVLTQEEQVRIQTTEVFLTDGEMLERGTCIHWSQFVERDNMVPDVRTIITVDDVEYLVEESGDEVSLVEGGVKAIYRIEDVIYNTPEKHRIDHLLQQEVEALEDENEADSDLCEDTASFVRDLTKKLDVVAQAE